MPDHAQTKFYIAAADAQLFTAVGGVAETILVVEQVNYTAQSTSMGSAYAASNRIVSSGLTLESSRVADIWEAKPSRNSSGSGCGSTELGIQYINRPQSVQLYAANRS